MKLAGQIFFFYSFKKSGFWWEWLKIQYEKLTSDYKCFSKKYVGEILLIFLNLINIHIHKNHPDWAMLPDFFFTILFRKSTKNK